MTTTVAPDDKAISDFITTMEGATRCGELPTTAPAAVVVHVDGAFELGPVPNVPAGGSGRRIAASLDNAAAHAADIVEANPDKHFAAGFVGVLVCLHTGCRTHGKSCTASTATLCTRDGRLFDKRTHDTRAPVPPTHPRVAGQVDQVVLASARLARALGRELDPGGAAPTELRYAWQDLAQEVLLAAASEDLERAMGLFQRLHDDYGPHVIPDVLVTWARMTLKERGIEITASPERLRKIVFLDVDTGNMETADEVPPSIRWAGRFVIAVSQVDRDQIEALVNSVVDTEQFTDNARALLHVCGLAIRMGTLREA